MTPVCSKTTLWDQYLPPAPLCHPLLPFYRIPGKTTAHQPVVEAQRVTVTSAVGHMASTANPDGDNEVERSKYPVTLKCSL